MFSAPLNSSLSFMSSVAPSIRRGLLVCPCYISIVYALRVVYCHIVPLHLQPSESSQDDVDAQISLNPIVLCSVADPDPGGAGQIRPWPPHRRGQWSLAPLG